MSLPDNQTVFDLNFCIDAMGAAGQRFFLDGPWFEPLEVVGNMVFGREADLPEEIRQSLVSRYDNISRRHAELRRDKGGLWVVDLGSSNGTFVNDVRLLPNTPVRLPHGAKLRFAADLTLTVRIENLPG